MGISDIYYLLVNIITKLWTFVIIKIIIVVVFTIIINYIVKKILKKAFTFQPKIKVRNEQLVKKNRETAYKLILSIWSLFIWVSLILVIFSIFGLDMKAVLASAGFLGIIVGLGTKSIIESLVTGFFLISDGNISVGDFVRINGATGVVTEIGIRNVIIRTNTGELNIQPVTNVKQIINYSLENDAVLVNLTIPTKYDFKNIYTIIDKELKELQNDKDIKTDLFISGYNIYNNNYEIRIECLTDIERHIKIQTKVRNAVLTKLKENQIEVV